MNQQQHVQISQRCGLTLLLQMPFLCLLLSDHIIRKMRVYPGRIDPPGRANEKMTRCKGDRLEPYHLLTSPLQSFSPRPLSLPQALMPSLSDHHACAAQ
jgi:hypothetical protein